MALVNKYLDIYEDVFHQVWEMTLGQCQEGNEAYKGIRYYSKFLLQEVERYQNALENGETAIETRGVAAPKSVISRHAADLVSSCHWYRLVPPYELYEVIYLLLGVTPDPAETNQHGNREKREKLFKLRKENPDMSLRKLAKEVNVDKRTIYRWLNQKYFYHDEDYRRIRNELNIEEFFPVKYRGSYYKKMEKRKNDGGAY